MNRRSFIAALFAPFVAKVHGLLPSREFITIDWNAVNAVTLAHCRPVVDNLFVDSPLLDRLRGIPEWDNCPYSIQEPFTYGGISREGWAGTVSEREIKGGIITS